MRHCEERKRRSNLEFTRKTRDKEFNSTKKEKPSTKWLKTIVLFSDGKPTHSASTLQYVNRGLERGIDRILGDRRLTLEKKGEIIYENTSHALMEAFQDPGKKLVEVERLGTVSGQVLRFITFSFSERRNFQGLNTSLSRGFIAFSDGARGLAEDELGPPPVDQGGQQKERKVKATKKKITR